MAHFKAIVKKGTHKTQPYTVTVDKRVDTKVKQRYKTQYSAERGALRQFRDELMNDNKRVLRIELPGGGYRNAWFTSDGGMFFGIILTPKKK